MTAALTSHVTSSHTSPCNSNAKINSALVQQPGCLDALKAMGWEEEAESESLVIPPGLFMTMQEVSEGREERS